MSTAILAIWWTKGHAAEVVVMVVPARSRGRRESGHEGDDLLLRIVVLVIKNKSWHSEQYEYS